MSDEEQQERVVDWASEYLGEGQNILEGAGHHPGELARADVLFQASAALSLYEIAGALKIMLPMLEQIATPAEQIQYEVITDHSGFQHHVPVGDESAHRSDDSKE